MFDGSVTSVLVTVLYVAAPLLLLVAVLLLLRAVIAGGVRGGLRDAMKDEDPVVVLQRRYARGEIDEAEYVHRREVLTGR